MDYKKLQNGSDIRGVALEGIEGQHINLTEQACKDIGRGFALWLKEKTGKTQLRVAVGRDSRLSGPQLCTWICEAMVQQGLQVTNFGMASTPAMFMATVTEGYQFDGTVMITASPLTATALSSLLLKAVWKRVISKLFWSTPKAKPLPVCPPAHWKTAASWTPMQSCLLTRSVQPPVKKSLWKASALWLMPATAQAASMPTRFLFPWAQTQPAAVT